MKIFKMADYCSGDFGEPTEKLDSQVFPCKKDPSVESRKKRKKKKNAFNLRDYKLAEVITGPDMNALTPSKLEEAGEWLRKKYPYVVWTVEKVQEWLNKHFSEKPKPISNAKDLARRPLD